VEIVVEAHEAHSKTLPAATVEASQSAKPVTALEPPVQAANVRAVELKMVEGAAAVGVPHPEAVASRAYPVYVHSASDEPAVVVEVGTVVTSARYVVGSANEPEPVIKPSILVSAYSLNVPM